MPKQTVSRIKSTKTYAKAPKRARTAASSPSPSTSSFPTPSPPANIETKAKPIPRATKSKLEKEEPIPDLVPSKTLSKDLALQIIIAKMEASKNCDWFELSKKLGWSANEGEKKGKGKSKGKVREALSGNELRDTYYDTVLPALKSGRALWRDCSNGSSSPSSTTYPMTPKTLASADAVNNEVVFPSTLAPIQKRAGKGRAAKEASGEKSVPNLGNSDEDEDDEGSLCGYMDMEEMVRGGTEGNSPYEGV